MKVADLIKMLLKQPLNAEVFILSASATHEEDVGGVANYEGDIYLVGMPLKGHFTLMCPGHRANVALAQQIRKLITNY